MCPLNETQCQWNMSRIKSYILGYFQLFAVFFFWKKIGNVTWPGPIYQKWSVIRRIVDSAKYMWCSDLWAMDYVLCMFWRNERVIVHNTVIGILCNKYISSDLDKVALTSDPVVLVHLSWLYLPEFIHNPKWLDETNHQLSLKLIVVILLDGASS